jgi:hypothetical protein
MTRARHFVEHIPMIMEQRALHAQAVRVSTAKLLTAPGKPERSITTPIMPYVMGVAQPIGRIITRASSGRSQSGTPFSASKRGRMGTVAAGITALIIVITAMLPTILNPTDITAQNLAIINATMIGTAPTRSLNAPIHIVVDSGISGLPEISIPPIENVSSRGIRNMTPT